MTEKRPPASTEAEQGIISHLLSSPRRLREVMDGLSSDSFVSEEYGRIYQTMLALASRGKACTVFNVYDELCRGGSPDDALYLRLEDYYANFTGTITPLEDQVEKVQRAAACRRLISAAQQIAESAYHQDENVLELAEQLIYQIALGTNTGSVSTLGEVKERYMQAFEERVKKRRAGVLSGISTGFNTLNGILDGLQPGELYILAARPSGGKTSLALCIAASVVKQASRCLFFSLEQDELSLFQRLLGMEMPLDQSFLRAGDVNDQELEHVRTVADELALLNLLIDDHTYTLAGICSHARREHAKSPLRLICLDYLQFIDSEAAGRAKNKMRYEEVGDLTKGLRRLARELNVPILLLAQLNRDVENRSSPKPRLSDLGESGKIEMDADTILFAYCEEAELAHKEKNEPYKVHITVAKQRNGRYGDEELWFRPRITKFQEEEPPYVGI